MDVTRSAIRLGAAKVTCVYRRRQEDMTAQQEEVEGAIAEGAEVLTLQAPLKIEADENGHVTALWTQPQIIGEMDKAGRPRPNTASVEPLRIPADTVIVAIGQGIESRGLEESGIKIQRGGNVDANTSTQIPDMEGVFAGRRLRHRSWPPLFVPLRLARRRLPTSTNIWASTMRSRWMSRCPQPGARESIPMAA